MSAAPTNQRYTWLISFPHKPFQWDIKLLFWAFNLLFVHPQASSGSSGTVFSLAPFPALHIRSVVNHVNLLATEGAVRVMISGKRHWVFLKAVYWCSDKKNLVPCYRRVKCLIPFRFFIRAICTRFLRINCKALQSAFFNFWIFLLTTA